MILALALQMPITRRLWQANSGREAATAQFPRQYDCVILRMLLSIAICTRNRALHLAQTLEAMRGLHCPIGATAELMVIDNASTDGTAEAIRGFKHPQIEVRHIVEPHLGLSNARNRAMYEARGECLLFTDDDVRVPPNWIEGMSAPHLAGKADITAGGVTLARHLRRPWMGATHLGYLASTEHTSTEAHPWPVGANMALSRRAMEVVTAFDPELGAGTAYGVGEETLYHAQAEKAGLRTAFEWNVVVEHHFEPERLKRDSFVAFAGKVGRSIAYRQYHWEYAEQPDLQANLKLSQRYLALKRIRYAVSLLQSEGIPLWELALLTEIARLKQLIEEAKRQRNYNQFAPTKLRGTLPHVTSTRGMGGSGVE